MRMGGEEESNLDITSPPIKIQVEVFDFPILCKFIRDILFSSFLMHVCDHYDPSFDSWGRGWLRVACGAGREKTYIVLPLSRSWIPHGQTFDLLQRRSRSHLQSE